MSESETKMFLDRLDSHQGRENLGTNHYLQQMQLQPHL